MSSRLALSAWAGLFGIALAGCGSEDEVRLVGPDGDDHLCVDAPIASTAEERQRGLLGRDNLPEDEGLLIQFPAEGEVCITTDGLGFALDVIFIDEARSAHTIERGWPAEGGTRCRPNTRWVLEIAAGVAAEANVGDRLEAARLEE